MSCHQCVNACSASTSRLFTWIPDTIPATTGANTGGAKTFDRLKKTVETLFQYFQDDGKDFVITSFDNNEAKQLKICEDENGGQKTFAGTSRNGLFSDTCGLVGYIVICPYAYLQPGTQIPGTTDAAQVAGFMNTDAANLPTDADCTDANKQLLDAHTFDLIQRFGSRGRHCSRIGIRGIHC
jgi:hypothetical protein